MFDVNTIRNSFERGDIVCINGSYGVVETSLKEWNRIVQHIKEGRISNKIEYVYVSVCCFDNNGIFKIECLPNEIEKVNRNSLEENYRILTNAGNLLKHKTSLFDFIEIYRKCYG